MGIGRLSPTADRQSREPDAVSIIGVLLAWRCARAAGWTLALASAASRVDAGSVVAAEGVVVRDRPRRTAAALRPLAVPGEFLELAADRKPVVVPTAPWHERDSQSLVERLGAPVFTPPPDTADDSCGTNTQTAAP
jgi:hypothetical protein